MIAHIQGGGSEFVPGRVRVSELSPLQGCHSGELRKFGYCELGSIFIIVKRGDFSCEANLIY